MIPAAILAEVEINFRRERLVLFGTTLIQSVTCFIVISLNLLLMSHALNYPALRLINDAIKMDNVFNVNLSHLRGNSFRAVSVSFSCNDCLLN